MTFISQSFQRAAAYSIARLPGFLARFVTEGEHWLAQWYQGNGYFKFPVGARLDYNMSVVGLDDFAPPPYGWTVHHHIDDGQGFNAYIMETETGAHRLCPKWNIEYQFRQRRRDTHIDPVKGMEISIK